MRKAILTTAAILLLGRMQAMELHDLRTLCPMGGSLVVTERMEVGAVVGSDCRSVNTALNHNVSYKAVDLGESRRTAYVQTEDGSFGARLVFARDGENALRQGDRIVLNLEGCTISCAEGMPCWTIGGASVLNIEKVARGEISPRELTLDKIDASHVNTLVTLCDVEFAFKDGCYTNVVENYAQWSEAVHSGTGYPVLCMMDGGVVMLRDERGHAISMQTNFLCPWRRNGSHLPAGVGKVTGILACTPHRRYGEHDKALCIRPLFERDMDFSAKVKSPYKTLVSWVPDGSDGPVLEFERLGTRGNLFKEHVGGDRILSQEGKGFLWTDAAAEIGMHSDLNDISAASKGWVKNSAILFEGRSADFYSWGADGRSVEESRGICLEFSAVKAKKTLMLCFDWAAGNGTAASAYGHIMEWNVEYSIDGQNFTPMLDAAYAHNTVVLRALPFVGGNVPLFGGTYQTYYDCGIGMQQHCFTFGPDALGAKKVIVRIRPAGTAVPTPRAKELAVVRSKGQILFSDSPFTTTLRFGTIKIEYM